MTLSVWLMLAWIATTQGVRHQTLRVVDATTGEPVSGVHVHQHTRNVEIMAIARNEDADLPQTDADGVVQVDGLACHGRSHQFLFSKAGYRTGSVEVGPGWFPKAFIASPIDAPGPGQQRSAVGTVTIALHRAPTPDGGRQ